MTSSLPISLFMAYQYLILSLSHAWGIKVFPQLSISENQEIRLSAMALSCAAIKGKLQFRSSVFTLILFPLII